jgi:hypothetical protein
VCAGVWREGGAGSALRLWVAAAWRGILPGMHAGSKPQCAWGFCHEGPGFRVLSEQGLSVSECHWVGHVLLTWPGEGQSGVLWRCQVEIGLTVSVGRTVVFDR